MRLGRSLPIVFLSACWTSAAPVSSTTTGHKQADVAPPPPDRAVNASTGETPIPPFDDARERIVYLRAGSIFVLDPRGGSDPARVTLKGGTSDEAPAFSPHGDAVAFASRKEGASRLYLAPLDGSGGKPLTDGAGGGDAEPAWSPDGRKLVFMRGVGGERRDVFVLDFDAGGAPRRVVEGKDTEPAFAGAPAFSPDGQWIVYASDRSEGEGTGLWLVAPDGKGLRRLTRPPSALGWVRDLRPAWSPDGKTIVFVSNRDVSSSDDAGDYDLYAVAVDTGKITRLTHNPGVADDPCYSPDGKRIYFTSTREVTRDWSVELYAMPAGGGEQRRMTRDEVPQNAAPSAGRVP